MSADPTDQAANGAADRPDSTDPVAVTGVEADAGGELLVPVVTGAARPDPRVLPSTPVTRFAPAPTGHLHLGHLVNAIYVWGIAAATGGTVVLRIEDHDRQRSRPEYEMDLLADLERLGLTASSPTPRELGLSESDYRQSDNAHVYAAALDRLRADGLLYACACTRATFAAFEADRGRPWRGIGCPGGCRSLRLDETAGVGLRVAVGAGSEHWVDLLAGPVADEPAGGGDLLVRDRVGNYTYALCVVVDDMRHGVSLVIRGRDLLDATPVQLRLARMLGRQEPPQFLHHPLVRRVSGQKLSKAEHDTSVRSMLDDGRTPAELFGWAARLAGLQDSDAPLTVEALGSLFRGMAA